MVEVQRCDVCSSTSLKPVLDLGSHPLCDDLVRIAEPRVCREFPIEILFCKDCHTALQRYRITEQNVVGRLPSDQGHASREPVVQNDHIIASCAARLGGLAGRTIIAVGGEDSGLANAFRAAGAKTIQSDLTLGVVPMRPDVLFVSGLLSSIRHPDEFLTSLHPWTSSGAMVIFQDDYLGHILANHQFDIFSHQHLRTFSCRSFVAVAQALGTKILEVALPVGQSESLRVLMGNCDETCRSLPDMLEHEKGLLPQFAALQSTIHRWQLAKSNEICQHMRAYGRLHAAAFPDSAAMLLKLLQLDEFEIDCVYEKPSSPKIGHYLPGTRIPIRSETEMRSLEEEPPVLLNLAWHQAADMRAHLSRQGYTGPVIDILAPKDLKAVA